MVSIKKEGKNFIFEIQGIHKLWTLKSRLIIPAKHIITAYPDTEDVHVNLGLRMPGTALPGLIQAGTFIGSNGNLFCDVTPHAKSIIIELRDDFYKRLIIDVEDPEKAVNLLKDGLH